ncbi:hypothetical protein [Methylomonas albis]|uniref:hypothetical protein n=1 Tax=Methylomonas albis TaxID=1854563 RepID=UPI002D21D9A3|nr:hypothetical protein [Methylomonas albis]
MKESQKAVKNDESMESTQGHKWQRRFWAHLIEDQDDYNRHADYIHWNPVKQGWVNKVCDRPYSSFHHYVEQGIYTENWGNNENADIYGIE